MKHIIFLVLISFIHNIAFSQCNGRYDTEIFSNVNVVTVPYSDVYSDAEHSMDIYTAIGDTVTNRPVILYMHGGSFYLGDKNMTDCVDFCTAFAKRGYVAVSINYRLADMFSFLLSQDEQYKAVLRAVADAKAAVRFFRKDFANGNLYGIDPTTCFVAGYSAGGVIAIHQAFIDDLSDLPSNVQALASAIGGNLEGDAGNLGYSSEVQGVVSLAGGINDVNWIDSYDEPIVSAQGTNDNTVNYNCGPGLNNPAILNLCGSGEIHPKADNVGLLNDKLIFPGEDHNWGVTGNSNPKFIQAIDFFSDFLYNLLPCNQNTAFFEYKNSNTFSFSPNPAMEKIKIQSNSTQLLQLEIYNLLGEIIYKKDIISQDVLIINELNPGVYIIKDRRTSNSQKLIIK